MSAQTEMEHLLHQDVITINDMSNELIRYIDTVTKGDPFNYLFSEMDISEPIECGVEANVMDELTSMNSDTLKTLLQSLIANK